MFSGVAQTGIQRMPLIPLRTTLRPSMRSVAREVRQLLTGDRASAVVGWPEKLFARINAILPGLVDGSIAKQLPVIRRHARKAS